MGKRVGDVSGSASVIRRAAILSMLSPADSERCLLSWIRALHEMTEGEAVTIDGKTLQSSFDKASNKSAGHMISA